VREVSKVVSVVGAKKDEVWKSENCEGGKDVVQCYHHAGARGTVVVPDVGVVGICSYRRRSCFDDA